MKKLKQNNYFCFFTINTTYKYICLVSRNTPIGCQEKKDFIEKILQHSYFCVKLAKYLRTSFLTEHHQWLPLDIVILLNILRQVSEVFITKFYEHLLTNSSSFQLFF